MNTNAEFTFESPQCHANKDELRKALRQEVKASHDHYMQTGLHLTNAEVVEWMDKAIQGEKVRMPKCHI